MISVDCGRDTVKVWDGNSEVLIFPAKVGEYRKLKLENKNPKWKVEVNGEKYFVGELAAKESYCDIQNTEENKAHSETKILTLTGVALISGEGPVVTSLPIDQFDKREQLSELLKGLHKVKINGDLKPVFINKLIFVPESIGIFYSEAILEEGLSVELEKKTRVLDIGSRTINFLTMENYQYISKESGTLDYGCIQYQEAAVEPEVFTKKIKADLVKRVHGWKASETVLIGGGGAFLLEKALTKTFPLARIVAEPVAANCKGNLKVVELWEKEKEK